MGNLYIYLIADIFHVFSRLYIDLTNRLFGLRYCIMSSCIYFAFLLILFISSFFYSEFIVVVVAVLFDRFHFSSFFYGAQKNLASLIYDSSPLLLIPTFFVLSMCSLSLSESDSCLFYCFFV